MQLYVEIAAARTGLHKHSCSWGKVPLPSHAVCGKQGPLNICGSCIRGSLGQWPQEEWDSALLGLTRSGFSSPAGLSVHCRAGGHWHLVTSCNWARMRLLLQHPPASQFTFFLPTVCFSCVFPVHGMRAEWWGTGMAHLEIPSQQVSGLLQLQRHALLSELLTTRAGQASKLHEKLGRVSRALM